MNEYIIYTTEGGTTAPNESVEVENCQVLGIVNAYTTKEAIENVIAENPWIIKAGFAPDKFIVRRLLTAERD